MRRERELRELGLVAGDDAREVHHLGEADHAAAAQERLEISLAERAPRRLEARRGDARRGHEVDVERNPSRCVEQPVDSVRAEHVRNLVRIGDDGCRAEREHKTRELVRQELRRFDVHVRVDEPGNDVLAAGVDDLLAVVRAEDRDPPVRDRHVHVEPLAREDREHPAAADDDVGRLVTACDCEAPCELGGHSRSLGPGPSTCRGTWSGVRFCVVDVLTPRSLDEALTLKAERPDALPIEGGTDVMVELNFDRRRPGALLNLNEVSELKGWAREDGTLRLGASLTYSQAMRDLGAALPALAEASRTVGSPQIRNRGTIGGNLGTASPAGDALPPLLVESAEIEVASARGTRSLPLTEFLVGPKQNALAE